MSSIALAQQLLAKEELHREQLSIEFVMSKADVAEVESVLVGVLQSVEMCVSAHHVEMRSSRR